MASHISFPAEGISRLVIAEVASDAHIKGIEGLNEILVTPAGSERDAEPAITVEDDVRRLHIPAAARVLLPAELDVEMGDARGELHVSGLHGDVVMGTVHGELSLRDLSGRVRLESVKGSLRADRVAALQVLYSCEGDIRFQEGGTLEAESMSGDLRVYNVESVRMEHVHGDFWAEKLGGALQLSQVDGDARLSEIAGPATVSWVGGDLRASGLTGGLAAPAVNGDAHLYGPFGPEASYTLAADADVHVKLPADADLKLSVRASGRIRAEFQLTPAPDGTPTFTATLGRGSGRMNISSGGDLRIAQAGSEGRVQTPAGGWQDLGEHIRRQVNASLAAAGIDMNDSETRWGAGMERNPKRRAPEPPARPRPPETPPAASPEEQMMVLKMLEAGTITAEEAETLLRSL